APAHRLPDQCRVCERFTIDEVGETKSASDTVKRIRRDARANRGSCRSEFAVAIPIDVPIGHIDFESPWLNIQRVRQSTQYHRIGRPEPGPLVEGGPIQRTHRCVPVRERWYRPWA